MRFHALVVALCALFLIGTAANAHAEYPVNVTVKYTK